MVKKLAISQRAYSKLKNQQTQLTWARIHTIAGILQVKPSDIISFNEEKILEKKHLYMTIFQQLYQLIWKNI